MFYYICSNFSKIWLCCFSTMSAVEAEVPQAALLWGYVPGLFVQGSASVQMELLEY